MCVFNGLKIRWLCSLNISFHSYVSTLLARALSTESNWGHRQGCQLLMSDIHFATLAICPSSPSLLIVLCNLPKVPHVHKKLYREGSTNTEILPKCAWESKELVFEMQCQEDLGTTSGSEMQVITQNHRTGTILTLCGKHQITLITLICPEWD